jgi:hypothetical protein
MGPHPFDRTHLPLVRLDNCRAAKVHERNKIGCLQQPAVLGRAEVDRVHQ